LTLAFVLSAALCSAAAADPIQVTLATASGTTAPTSLPFVRATLQNTTGRTQTAEVRAPETCQRVRITLPPNSRKSVTLHLPVSSHVQVTLGDEPILSERVNVESNVRTILVISERDTGLRFLEKIPAPGGVPVRVEYLSPSRLPESWHLYSNGPLLIVAHPGGYDSMTAPQRRALRIRARYSDNVVLVSEGRADPFAGTPLQGLAPAKPAGVGTFQDWPHEFPGSNFGAAAVALVESENGAIVKNATSDGNPLVVSRIQRTGNAVTLLAFDYSAPPLRSWNSEKFWLSLVPDPPWAHGLFSAVGAMLADKLELNLHGKATIRIAPGVLALLAVVIAAGYGIRVIHLRGQRRGQDSARNWLMGTLATITLFGFCTLAARGTRRAASETYNCSVSSFLDDSSLFRLGAFGIRGQAVIPAIRFKSPNLALFPLGGTTPSPAGKLWFNPGPPPELESFGMDTFGGIQCGFADVQEIDGPVKVTATPANQQTNEWLVEVENRSGLQLEEGWFFHRGESAELGNTTPHAFGRFTVTLRPPKSSPVTRGGLAVHDAMEYEGQRLSSLAAQGQAASQAPASFAIFGIPGNGPLPAASTTADFLVVDTEIR
jgi:hypothetical protein